MISDYLDSLTAALSFDRSLSRRVREEIEDHLREAMAADPARDRREAERRAIAACGAPGAIAAEFAAIALARQTSKLCNGVMLAIAGIYVAMKARMVWYAATPLVLSDEMRHVAGFVRSIDIYAFWTSLVIGLACWAYAYVRRIPPGLHP